VKSLLKFKTHFSFSLLKPSLTAGVSYLSLLILVSSCSTFKIPGKKKGGSISKAVYKEMTPADYADHLASLRHPFLNTPGIKSLRMGTSGESYLIRLTNEIILNNEIFFKQLRKAEITILDTDVPLHFSLPKGQIFISRGLISKYIKHESMLAGILAYELVRSENVLYPKQIVIPVGYVPLERMLGLSRLNLEEKMEIHKWAYYLTTRSGFDGEYYLSWLQTQNRNTADFLLQVGDVNQINREESLFKAFLIKTSSEDDQVAKKNSSKTFYSFINSIRDGN
jgi:hypothetical protein